MPDTDVVERVRMALAEAGYPDACVIPDGPCVWLSPGVPVEVMWRAVVVAGALSPAGKPMVCLACILDWFETDDEPAYDCLARGEGIEDCGAERSVV